MAEDSVRRMEEEAASSEDLGPWKTWARNIVVWAAQDPWTFIFNVFLLLSPFLLVSLYLSYKLSNDIENKKAEKRKKKPMKGKKKKKDG